MMTKRTHSYQTLYIVAVFQSNNYDKKIRDIGNLQFSICVTVSPLALN